LKPATACCAVGIEPYPVDVMVDAPALLQ